MVFSSGKLFLPLKALFHTGLFFLIFSGSGLLAQSIKEIKPTVLCVNEEVTITGKELNKVTKVDFNGISLFLSDGDYTIVNKGTIRFSASAASATEGEELVTTIIYTGLFGAFLSDSKEIRMTINPIHGPPNNPVGGSYCEGDATGAVSVDDPGIGFRIDWYDAPTGGALLGSGTVFTPPGPGTFFAEMININTGCGSENRVSATLDEISAPAPPSGSVNSSYCEGDPLSPVSVDDPGNGYRIDWYSVSTGGSVLFSGIEFTPSQSGTYYAEVVNINTGCSSLSREPATVDELPAPPNATNPVNARFCGDDPVPPVRVDDPGNGFMVSWLTTATGSTLAAGIVSGNHGEIFTPSNRVSASYYAEVTNTRTGCISKGRTRVTVEKDPLYCTNTDISSFYFNEQDDPSEINEINHRIQIVLPYGVSLTNLIAYFTLAPGATAAINGKIQQSGITHNDFSQPLTYRITAPDRVTIQDWNVIAVSAANEATQILTYGFPEQTGPAIIDRGNNIISVEIGFLADITNLVANFTLSDGATATVNGIEQISGVTGNDFSQTVFYTIKAQDQISTAEWRVRVTEQDIVDDEDPVIGYGTLPVEYPVSSDSIPASVVVMDNIGIRRVVFRYKKYQDTEWEEVRIASSDSLYTHYIIEPIIGGHGMTYYFKAYDYNNNTDSTGIFNIILRYDSQNSPVIPNLSYGGSIQDYHIISIPMDLEEKNIDRIFDELMPYDIKKWRFLHYNNGITNEFGEFLHTLYPGKGYWLIIRNPDNVQVGSGTTVRIENEQGFAMTLQPGWNQVGNPYNFDVSWDDVIAFNANPNIGKIKLYENGILMEADKMPPYRGGFVFLSGIQSAFLNIPPNPGFSSTRMVEINNRALLNPINGTDWQLNLKASSGGYTNSLNVMGIHPESIPGYDKKDEPLLSIPKQIAGFDLYFIRQGEEYDKLNKDIAGPGDFQTWELEVKKHDGSGNIIFQWENSHFGDNSYKLIMIDETNDRMIDMRLTDSYSFFARGIHKFRLFYGTEERLSKEILPLSQRVGDIYPNPFEDELYIPVSLPDRPGLYQLEMSLSDLKGKVIQILPGIFLNPGYHQISWKMDQPTKLPKGIYFLKISVVAENDRQVFYRKMLKY